MDGQKTLGRDDFSKIPNGGPGVEDRLYMLYHFGCNSGRLSLTRFVELVSTNPAKLFGLYPRKGTISPGSDGDILVWDPEKSHVLTAAGHHSKVDYNLYEGTEVRGAPAMVIVRGQVIVEEDELVGQPGDGRFVKRARFGEQDGGRGSGRLARGEAVFGISVGGIIVIVGLVVMFVFDAFWLGLIVALVGLVAFGGFARGKWY